MLTSGNDEQLEFVGRQLSYMAKRPDFNLDAALEKLQGLGNANLGEVVAKIKQPADRQAPTSNRGLFSILDSAAPGADVGGVIIEYMAIKKRLEQDMAIYIAGLRGSLIYNLVLLAVAMLLCSIFKEKVATTLQSFFGSNIHQLPDFTAFMLTHGSQYGLDVLSVIFLVICVIGAALFKVHQDVVHFRYSKIGLTWLLAGTGLLTVANTYVLLAYMKLLITAGHLPDEAEALAPRMAGFGVPAVGSVLPGG
ncbi:MAG: hypothetical protein R3240_09720, partial [Gammaproteobacteria bacterium]|nr:hypothetical protein [Gammaproteobacteria bacterium]